MEILGFILFVAGAAISLLMYIKYKKSGTKKAAIYLKANPDKKRTAKIAGAMSTIGFWLMMISIDIKY